MLLLMKFIMCQNHKIRIYIHSVYVRASALQLDFDRMLDSET